MGHLAAQESFSVSEMLQQLSSQPGAPGGSIPRPQTMSEHPPGVLFGNLGLLKLLSLPRTLGRPDVHERALDVQGLVRQGRAHSPAQLHRKNGLYFVYTALWD